MEITKYNEAKVLQNQINLFTEIVNWYNLNNGAISNLSLSTELIERIDAACRKLSDSTVFTDIVMPNIVDIKDGLVSLIAAKQLEFDNLTCSEIPN